MGRRRGGPPKRSGLLNIDKPTGMTSHDVVDVVRRKLGERQVGHTGTLDPMASGVLVVAVGKATRLCRFVEATDKGYDATITLGRATNTFDAEGEETASAVVGALDREAIDAALVALTGEIDQQVPAFSAVKIGGERLYQKARKGEVVEAPIRRVRIERLEATRVALPEIDVTVTCGKGTYIRSLAVQIGAALGLPAHLSRLRRTAVGAHQIADAIALASLDADTPLLPVERAVAHLPRLTLAGPVAEAVAHGRAPTFEDLAALGTPALAPGATVAVMDDALRLLAVGVAVDPAASDDPRALRYACVLVV